MPPECQNLPACDHLNTIPETARPPCTHETCLYGRESGLHEHAHVTWRPRLAFMHGGFAPRMHGMHDTKSHTHTQTHVQTQGSVAAAASECKHMQTHSDRHTGFCGSCAASLRSPWDGRTGSGEKEKGRTPKRREREEEEGTTLKKEKEEEQARPARDSFSKKKEKKERRRERQKEEGRTGKKEKGSRSQ